MVWGPGSLFVDIPKWITHPDVASGLPEALPPPPLSSEGQRSHGKLTVPPESWLKLKQFMFYICCFYWFYSLVEAKTAL